MMASSLLGVACLLTAASATSHPTGPVDWSRDGRWIAWTAVEAADAPALPRGWLLRTEAPPPPPAGAPGRRIHRVWAARFPSLESVLIQETADPVSSPCWSADGRAMAYARFVPSDPDGGGDRRGRFEVVVRSGLDEERVEVIHPDLTLDAAGREAIASIRPALGPDGRRVAVPRPGSPAGFWLVSPGGAGGGAVETFEDGLSPTWSPDGRRLAYLTVEPGPGGAPLVALRVNPSRLGDERPLWVDSSLTTDFLGWASDGQSLLAITNPLRGPLRNAQRDLVQIDLDGRMLGRPSTLEAIPPADNQRRLRGPGLIGPRERPASIRVDLSMDETQEEGICLIETGDEEQVLRWGNVRTQNTFKRFHPLDAGMRIGSPALAPDGRTAAFRVDDGTGAGLLALIDLDTEELTLLAPDETTRRRWLDRLADCALAHLREWLPSGDETPSRPTALPILAELGGVHPRRYTLGRLARFAAPLLKEPAEGETDGLDEFRLFFSYLNQDYDSASRWLDAVEAATEDPDARLRLLGLRAQILLGAGKVDAARGIIDYLGREARSTAMSIEEAAGGYVLADEASPQAGWVAHLREKSSDAALRRMGVGLDGRPLSTEPADPFAAFEEGDDQDRMPNAPFAPAPDGDPGIVPIVPDEFNPPGLRPDNFIPPPAPGPRPPGLLPRFAPFPPAPRPGVGAGPIRLEVVD
ncbi:hypothetical protein [Paludisphaera sp.]|uniref:TolB family protein n=1 Tax=Paludisphaera sp. TaxID=2017432 RepID=UPI00301DE189